MQNSLGILTQKALKCYNAQYLVKSVQKMPIDDLLEISRSPPEELESWLNHQSSLTEKLKDKSGEAKLEVLRQVWTKPNWWDRYILSLEEEALHREILMFSKETACWYARTIIPVQTFQRERAFFDRLSNEPIGVLLFNEPTIRRLLLKSYAINKDCLEYHWLPERLKASLKSEEELWLRFSIFSMASMSKLYLVEIMLPGLLRVIQ